MAEEVTTRMTDQETVRFKQWIMQHVRKSLRGQRMTDQIDRFSKGEIPDYAFNLEVRLDSDARDFIRNPSNKDILNNETL